MRLVTCALSAVLLSGCSWLGIGGNHHDQHQSYSKHKGGSYDQQAGYAGQLGPCQISSPMQAIPQGCRPEQVTLAISNNQAAQYGQAQYTSGGYGSHAASASANTQYHTPAKRKKRPWLRGSLGLEIDHSNSGNIFSPAGTGGAATYDRTLFEEGFTSGTVGTGQTVDTLYTSSNARLGQIDAPDVSFDDVYNAPLRLTAGLEVILSDHATVFANAGYTRAEGKRAGGAQINEELLRTITTTDYDAGGAVTGTVANTTFIPNETVAIFDYAFNDMERVDFEAGGRYYFNQVFENQINRPLTPFVAASGGLAYYSDTTVVENQRQRYLQRAFEGTQVNPEGDFYDVNFGTPTQLYDSQWVPYGAVKAGLEWQVTAKTALAFEAGVKYEGARDFSSGAEGDNNISIPIAIRGSYNF